VARGNYQRLGNAKPAAATDVILYTCPPGKSATFTTYIANTAGTSQQYRLYVLPDDDIGSLENKYYLAYDDTSVLGTTVWPTRVLTGGQSIGARSTNGNLAFTVMGVEENKTSGAGVLGAIDIPNGTYAVSYTCPQNTSAIVRQTIFNRGGSASRVHVAVISGSDVGVVQDINHITYNSNVPANSGFYDSITLGPNQSIIIKADTANVNAVVQGFEDNGYRMAGAIQPTANTDTVVYTCPSKTIATVKLRAANLSGTAETLKHWIIPDDDLSSVSDKYRVEPGLNSAGALAGYGTRTATNFVLGEGQSFVVNATNGTAVFNAYVAEEPATTKAGVLGSAVLTTDYQSVYSAVDTAIVKVSALNTSGSAAGVWAAVVMGNDAPQDEDHFYHNNNFNSLSGQSVAITLGAGESLVAKASANDRVTILCTGFEY